MVEISKSNNNELLKKKIVILQGEIRWKKICIVQYIHYTLYDGQKPFRPLCSRALICLLKYPINCIQLVG